MSFSNKVVIVTGASSGIGATAAVAFSSEGARVVLVGRNKENLAAVANKCKNSLVIVADVSDDVAIQSIIEKTIEKYGQIDVLINNAGTGDGSGGLIDGEIMKCFDKIMNVNLRAAVFLTTLATPHLIKTKGNVVNISSIAGQMSPFHPGIMSYSISKAALNHFTVCAATELGPQGVRVNAISPGPVVTSLLENSKLETSWEYFNEKNCAK